MSLKIICPGCAKAISAPPKYAGRTAPCPGCGMPIDIPLESVAPPLPKAQIGFDEIIEKEIDAAPVTIAQPFGEPEHSSYNRTADHLSNTPATSKGSRAWLGRFLALGFAVAAAAPIAMGAEEAFVRIWGPICLGLGIATYFIFSMKRMIGWFHSLNSTPQIGYGLAGITCLGVLLAAIVSQSPSNRLDDKPTEDDAQTIAYQFVAERLRNPSSADFVPGSVEVFRMGEKAFAVRGQVNAENAFGGTVRNRWRVEVRYEGNGKWSCQSMTFAP